MAVDPFRYGQMVRYLGTWFFPASFIVPCLWSIVLLWRAVRRLRDSGDRVMLVRGTPGVDELTLYTCGGDFDAAFLCYACGIAVERKTPRSAPHIIHISWSGFSRG